MTPPATCARPTTRWLSFAARSLALATHIRAIAHSPAWVLSAALALSLFATVAAAQTTDPAMNKGLIQGGTEIIPAASDNARVFGGTNAASQAASMEDYRVIHSSGADDDNNGFLDRATFNDLDGAGLGVVDWVLVQIRIVDKPAQGVTATPPTSAAKRIVSKVGLLLTNGIVVDADEPTGDLLSFEDVDFDPASEDLYVAVNHRNHVPILSQNPVADDGVAGGTAGDDIYDYDFALATNVQGQPISVNVRGGTAAMIAADFSRDGAVDLLTDILERAVPNIGSSGYLAADANLDGSIDLLTDILERAVPNTGSNSQFTF